jgi:hypothetical protein
VARNLYAKVQMPDLNGCWNKASRIRIVIVAIFLLPGCSTITVRYPHDPAGGALTESVGCIYDFDRDGFWYVVFVRADGLLNALHRHDPGIHLFLDRSDLLFFVRCSGRNETIDLKGETFALSKGTVFLCDIAGGALRVKQLRLPAIACDGRDAASRAHALAELSIDSRVSAFLPLEAQARLMADWKMEQRRNKESRKE